MPSGPAHNVLMFLAIMTWASSQMVQIRGHLPCLSWWAIAAMSRLYKASWHFLLRDESRVHEVEIDHLFLFNHLRIKIACSTAGSWSLLLGARLSCLSSRSGTRTRKVRCRFGVRRYTEGVEDGTKVAKGLYRAVLCEELRSAAARMDPWCCPSG